jgi:Ca2+-binding RTX toxin-like protein
LVHADTITDFASGTDKIALSKDIFGLAGATVGTTTNLAGLGSHFAYDNATGALTYDADGVGGNAAVTFAILGQSTHPASLSNDFTIVA